MIYLRSLLFYIGYVSIMLVTILPLLIIGLFLNTKLKFKSSGFISNLIMLWLRVSCNIKVEITNQQVIATSKAKYGGCVYAGNHQSPWETYVIQQLIGPSRIVLKRELLWIPIFGWAIAMLNPIALNRSNKIASLRQVSEEGVKSLKQQQHVLLFPEGTRSYAPKLGPFARTNAKLAYEAKTVIIPFCHNAGKYWPAHKFLKYPGTIKLIFCEPLMPQADSKKTTFELRALIGDELAKIS